MAIDTGVRTTQLFIAGRYVDSLAGETFDSINPATGEVIARVAKGGIGDADQAISAARRAFDEGPWPGMAPYDRGRILQKIADLIREHADDLTAAESADSGKPMWQARFEVTNSARFFDYYAGAGDKFYGETIPMGEKILDFTLREPVGVCTNIVPWNMPFRMAAKNIAQPLAAGCTVILKPASSTPLTAVMLAELCAEAGVPEGVVNVLTGPGAQIGEYLASHPQVDKVAFTGETLTGERILAAAAGTIKKVSLELGGKSPNIVFSDANFEKAAREAVNSAYFNAGQVCSARTRLFLDKHAYDTFMNLLIDATTEYKVGMPDDPDAKMGPVVSKNQHERVLNYVEIGQQEGAELVQGGRKPAGLGNGYFVEPAIFSGVSNTMRIAREEIFGPVLSVIPFNDEAEAIQMANATDYGLEGSVWTQDISRALRVVKAVRTGRMSVNSNGSPDMFGPLGGYKRSGLGREHAMDALETYTLKKNVYIDLS
jgi:acyl-CoA reductase-like NAD-dependent aldehyde dehydrogenase